MSKRAVYLAQVNNTYGRNAFLPYSVGLIQAYCQESVVIREHYDFRGFCYFREDIETVVARMEECDVFGASCYIWNSTYTLALAAAVRRRFPDCLIVLGGPHVPLRCGQFFFQHPFVDILVHYEGELAFADILRERLKPIPNYTNIWGLTVRCPDLGAFRTIARDRIADLSLLPSPYLTGVFDEVLKADYDFHASQETNRGCLAAGTKVTTLNGDLAIEDVRPGESVLGWDEQNQQASWNKIERSVCTGYQPVFRVIAGEHHVEATTDHPIYTTRGWLRVDELRQGDLLLCRVQRSQEKTSQPDVQLCLRTDAARTEDANSLYRQAKVGTKTDALYDLQRTGSLALGERQAPVLQVLLTEVRQAGKNQSDQEAVEANYDDTPRAAVSDLRKAYEATENVPQGLLNDVCSRKNSTNEIGRQQSGEAARSAGKNIGYGEEDVTGVVDEIEGHACGRKDQVSSPARAGTEQVRTESCEVYRRLQSAIPLRRRRSLLGRPGSDRNASQSGLRASGNQDEDGNSSQRYVLAYAESSAAPTSTGRLRSVGLARVRDLGHGRTQSSHATTDRGFLWVEVDDVIPAGHRRVYDLINARPFPNFFADNVLVHNCPYSCTFCDWGSNTMAKLKQFPIERLVAEIEWFAERRIDLLYNCDANYAIFPRDLELTEKMAEIKRRTGFPKKFRAAYAKNSNDAVFNVARILHKAGMNKGVTLSFQSMHDETLQLIKRKNIKIENFADIIGRYRAEGIATYSEIIVGLPGETYESFADGLDLLVESGQHDSLQVYTCEVLPNSEMGHPEYQQLHGLETVHTPVLVFHGTPTTDPHQEHYELVVATKTLPPDDWMKCQLLSWAFQAFHCLGALQAMAVFIRHHRGIRYRTFYERLIDLGQQSPETVLGKAVTRATECFENLRAGKSWGFVDPRFGNIIWPPEEAGFLTCVADRDEFYRDVTVAISSWPEFADVSPTLLFDISVYQQEIAWAPGQEEEYELRLIHNIHETVTGYYERKPVEVGVEAVQYVIRPTKTYRDLETYAREVVWYGRKGGRFRHVDITNVGGLLV